MDKPEIYRMVLNYKLIAIGCASLFKRDILDDVLPIPDYSEGHDWWVAMVAVRRNGIKYYDKVLASYRRHDANISEFSNNLSESRRILRYLSSRNRKIWHETRSKLKNILERSLMTRLSLEDWERKAIKESIVYIDSFLNSRLSFKASFYGFKHRQYLFSKKNYFWLESMTHLYNIIGKMFS